jgi:hypothetical protein
LHQSQTGTNLDGSVSELLAEASTVTACLADFELNDVSSVPPATEMLCNLESVTV